MTNRGTETEIKMAVRDRQKIMARLEQARVHQSRAFEDNVLYDCHGELKHRGCVLRIRRYEGQWTITFKGTKTVDSRGIKTRPEHETELADGEAMVSILRSLGYQPCFRYQKYRTIFEMDGIQVMLDETPMGDFIELEGDADAIERVRHALGLQDEPGIPESYVALYEMRRKPSDPEFMVFPELGVKS